MTSGNGSLQPLEAVLFDMDGTLVETEHLWDRSLELLAEQLGGRMSDDVRPAMVGVSVAASLQLLYADLGVSRTDSENVADERYLVATTRAQVEAGVRYRPGARELLTAARAAGLATALVTSTERSLTDVVLGHVGAHLFDVTVCGDEVPATKPDPAPYLQAAAALGVRPTRCLVVEDSRTGAAAGLAAGATVLGVPTLQPLEPQDGLVVRETLAGLTVADLTELVLARV
ncbi:HAD family hydrolase [Modestobacter roseus]|uniref:HAD superfamily hydrolase (TIGR01509 family) n=1 Tax=Modestobacter roseus TaxID=1181884 RepID=A0A562IPX0_9ACTN|nr:HAD family hydrolase [Modestobacter roseus]MQA34592.1 HAD-IA family hydrolase [Modestobacter roseus]TWH72856.1 HAD superfamily hydrolase (TIGR01509 family) [Modestobacter roseus]